MIYTIYDYFKGNLKNIDSKIVNLIRNKGYTLLCMWIDTDYTKEPYHNDYYDEKVVLEKDTLVGYYKYWYDDDLKECYQGREELELTKEGCIRYQENSAQVSFVTQKALKNMIHNGVVKEGYRDTYNSKINTEFCEDFFVQWYTYENEPERMVLIEPDTPREMFDEFVLEWVNRNPKYHIALEFSHYCILLGVEKFRKIVHNDEIVDFIYENLYSIFNDDFYPKFEETLEQEFEGEIEKGILKLYMEDRTKFEEMFSNEYWSNKLLKKK